MKLYSFFRSSAAYRARIALHFKGLAFETVPVHLTRDGGRQHAPEFRAVNPQKRVPALALDNGEVLLQSLAIMEYLDEVYPDPPLLPKDPIERARVRAVVDSSDTVANCETVRLDGDGDGVLAASDCDDRDPAIHPGAVDVPGDGIELGMLFAVMLHVRFLSIAS